MKRNDDDSHRKTGRSAKMISGLDKEKSPDDFAFEGGRVRGEGASGTPRKDAGTLASVDSPDDVHSEPPIRE